MDKKGFILLSALLISVTTVTAQSGLNLYDSNIDLQDNNITNPNEIKNFFDSACGQDSAVAQVYSNGSYSCVDIPDLEKQNLSEVLVEGNVANQSIDMDDNSIRQIENISFGKNRDVAWGENASLSASELRLNVTGDQGALITGTNVFGFPEDLVVKGAPATGTANTGGNLILESGGNPDGVAGNVRIRPGEYKTGYGPSDVIIGGSNTGAIGLGTDNPDTFVDIEGGKLDLSGNNITSVANLEGFFDQDRCADDEAIKTVYPNGSYECNSISTDQTVENLSETLAAGNVANQSVEFSGAVALGNNIDYENVQDSAISIGRGAGPDVGGRSGISIGKDSDTDDGVALGNSATSAPIGAIALGNNANTQGNGPTGQYAIALGRSASTEAEGAVAIGDRAVAPNSYEATFGNLGNQRLDLNVTGNATIHQDADVQGDLNVGGELTGVDIPEDTGTENLSETLAAGNVANQSIDLDQNGLLDTSFIDGGGDAIQVNDDLDLGNNKLLFGGGNISGGINFESDINLNGNDLQEIGFLNPRGSSTNFGGDLNVGGDRITSTDNIEFSRGIEIGDSETYTGSKQVQEASSFIVSTGEEWNQNGTAVNNISVAGDSIQLSVVGDTFDKNFNTSFIDIVSDIEVDSNGNIYPVGGDYSTGSVRKIDSSGAQQWDYGYGVDFRTVEVDSKGNVYTGDSENNVAKLNSSGDLQWYKDQGGNVDKVLGIDVDPSGNVYVGGQNEKVIKYDSEGNQLWEYTYGESVNDLVVKNEHIYAGGRNNTVVKLNFSGSEKKRYNIGNIIYGLDVDSSGNIYLGAESGGIDHEILKIDSSGTQQWSYQNDVDVSSLDIDASGNTYFAGGNGVTKLDQNGDKVWNYDKYSYSVAVKDSTVAVGSSDEAISLENIVEYADKGEYSSDVFNASSVQPFPEFSISSFVDLGTELNVTVELSNSSDMSSSVTKKLRAEGGTEQKFIGERARYAQFDVEMNGDTTDTPELDLVRIDYGNDASAYGYNQIALGQSATTDAEGAVAIGYNATSNEEYTARFGNNNGQEMDVDVTGNLSVDGSIENFFDQDECADDEAIKTVYPNGSYECNSISTTTEAENLSETLSAGNEAGSNDINLSGNSIQELNSISSEKNGTVDSFEDQDIDEYSGNTSDFSTGSSDPSPQDGSYRLKGTTSDTSIVSRPGDGLGKYPKQGDTISHYFYLGYPGVDSVSDGGFLFGLENSDVNSLRGYKLNYGGTYVSLDRLDDGSITNLASKSDGSLEENTWYRAELDWDRSGRIKAEIFDTNGNKVTEISAVDDTYDGRGIGFETNYVSSKVAWDGLEITERSVGFNGSIDLQGNSLRSVDRITSTEEVKLEGNANLTENNVTNADTVESDRVETQEISSTGRMCIGDRC